MSALRCVAVVAALICVVSVATAAPPATAAPRFAIDLNTDPLHRYDAVVPFFQGKFQAVIDYFDHIVPPALQPYLDPVLAKFDDYLPAEYSQEIRGIAQLAGVDLGKLVAMNLIYELTAYCTSIVAQDPNGSIYHSRNLDYDIPGLANLTVTFDFQQNNVTVYSCTTFAGYIGCLTGVRANAFSVSVNERDDGSGILKSIYAFLEGGKSIGMFLRSTLATVTSFDAALNNVTNTILVAPVYITMGGVKAGEGAIVTRNRTEVDNLWRIDAASGQWFILETNDDHWKPPADGRRDAANKSMNSLGQNSLDSKGLYNVLSIPPVFNPTTVYTTSMMAAHGTCDSMVRWDIPSFGERPVRSVSAKLKV